MNQVGAGIATTSRATCGPRQVTDVPPHCHPSHLQDMLLAGLVLAGPGEGGPTQLHRVLGGGQGAGVPLQEQGDEGGTAGWHPPRGDGDTGVLLCRGGCGLSSSRKAGVANVPLSLQDQDVVLLQQRGCCGHQFGDGGA